jgi:hypothetical protein
MGSLGKADQLPAFTLTERNRGLFGEIDREGESALAGERQTSTEQVLMKDRLVSASHNQRHIVVKKVQEIPDGEGNCFAGRSAATKRIEESRPTSVIERQRRRIRRSRRQALPVEKKADIGDKR